MTGGASIARLSCMTTQPHWIALAVALVCTAPGNLRAGESTPSSTAAAPTPDPAVLVVKGQGFFPVALRLADGRLAAVLRGGAPHIGLAGRLDIVFSTDDGRTWTAPSLVVDGPLDDRNPAFGQAADGSLVVGYWECGYYDASGQWAPNAPTAKARTLATRSTDGGKSWTTPEPIDLPGLKFGSPYGRILTMPDQTMLMNVYGVIEGGSHDSSLLFCSKDHGKTWTRHSVIAADGFNETGLARLNDGTLAAALRHDQRAGGPGENVWIALSKDKGLTWSAPVSLTPDRVHPADLVVMRDGRLALVAGDRRNPFGLVGIVGDARGGFEWAAHRVLLDRLTNGDCGYPSAVALNDGTVLVVYYAVGSQSHPDWGVHAGALLWRP